MTTLSLFTRRDPFADFDALVRSNFASAAAAAPERIDFTPAVETVRDGDDVVVRLELPGIDIERDVTVEVVSGRLVVRGERRDERADDTEGRRIREIRYGSFERSFGLPSHVSADDVSARYDAGVLSVRVAGVHAGTQPTRITVEAAAPGQLEVEHADDES